MGGGVALKGEMELASSTGARYRGSVGSRDRQYVDGNMGKKTRAGLGGQRHQEAAGGLDGAI